MLVFRNNKAKMALTGPQPSFSKLTLLAQPINLQKLPYYPYVIQTETQKL